MTTPLPITPQIPKALVAAVARRCGITKSDIRRILAETVDEIQHQAEQQPLVFRHFGTFYMQKVKGRVRQLHGRTYQTEDHEKLAFRVSK